MTRLIVVTAASIGLILFVAFIVSRLLLTRTRGVSIRMQVFLALAFIVGTFAVGLGLMVIDRIEARAVRLATQAATDEARSLAGMVQSDLERSGSSLQRVATRLARERAHGANLRLELLDTEGQLLFPPEGSAQGEPGTVSVEAPIYHSGEMVGSVRVVKPTVVMKRLLADFAPTVLVISLLLGTVSALAAAWIGRAIARPIETLTNFSERVSAGEPAAAPVGVFGREMTRLARSIDSMRRQLQGRPFVETFAMDLSHELKNPVAAIRASAEVLREGALNEPEEAERFLARIREATERIERLLRELLSLARIEARGAESFEPLDLARLAESAVRMNPEGEHRVTWRCTGDARVRGDAGWLTRALCNLIDNALVHSPPDSPVELELRREGSEVRISVVSQGAISAHVRSRLFRRFVTTRADKGGSGLGLAIVRAVAEAHGGSIELASSGPREVRFVLRMPAVPSLSQ